MNDAERIRARIETQVAARRASAGRKPVTAPPTRTPARRRPKPYPTPPTAEAAEPDPARPDTPPQSHTRTRGLLRFATMLAVVAVVAVLVHAFVLAQYYIPSGSMEPTLHGCTGCNDDHVLVDKLSYHLHDAHRGDVVVFHRPSSWHIDDAVLIKRVVGLPGDRLQVEPDGTLYVNGTVTDEPYRDPGCGRMPAFGPVRVPADQVFVMGDNRCDSSDSRVHGPVPESDIIGRAFVIVWPLGRIHWL